MASQSDSISYIIDRKKDQFVLKIWDRQQKIWLESIHNSYDEAVGAVKKLQDSL